MLVLQAVVKCTDITQLPQSLCRCMKMKKLTLHSNLLNTLPNDIGNLRLLNSLDLNLNVLEGLPKSFASLKCLHTLKLGGKVHCNCNYLKKNQFNLIQMLTLFKSSCRVFVRVAKLAIYWKSVSFARSLKHPHHSDGQGNYFHFSHLVYSAVSNCCVIVISVMDGIYSNEFCYSYDLNNNCFLNFQSYLVLVTFSMCFHYISVSDICNVFGGLFYWCNELSSLMYALFNYFTVA